THATTFAPSGRCPAAVTVPARGQLWQNMPSLLNNYMGSVTQDRDPTTPPDWQVLLRGRAVGALCRRMCRRMGFTAAHQSASGGDGMIQNPSLAALSAAGVSVWLDDLSRNLLRSGKLQQLIDTRSVVGVTTNPSTFERALNKGRAYDGQIAELTACGTDIDTAIRTVVTDDVRAACDVLRPRLEASGGGDSRVSIEVDPRLAHNTDAFGAVRG